MNYYKQHLFDKACLGVIRQGRPAMSGQVCAYLNDEGLRCAVGHLLPRYKAEWLTGSFKHWSAGDKAMFPKSFHDLIDDLQFAHDHASAHVDFLGTFKNNARTVARDYGLSTRNIDGKITL